MNIDQYIHRLSILKKMGFVRILKLITYWYNIRKLINQKAFTKIRSHYKKELNKRKTKYFNIDFQIWNHLRHAIILQLDKSKPIRILDIGCGGGMFSIVSAYFGHEVIGIDAPGKFHADVAAVLGVKRKEHLIRPLEPQPSFGGPFDLITAFATKFDHHTFEYYKNGLKKEMLWSDEEWSYFLLDLSKQLNNGGRFFFKLNNMKIGCDAGRFLSKSAERSFLNMDAKLDYNYLSFSKKQVTK